MDADWSVAMTTTCTVLYASFYLATKSLSSIGRVQWFIQHVDTMYRFNFPPVPILFANNAMWYLVTPYLLSLSFARIGHNDIIYNSIFNIICSEMRVVGYSQTIRLKSLCTLLL